MVEKAELETLGFLKKLWVFLFYLLEKLYKIVIFIIIIIAIHYTFSVIADRSIYLYGDNFSSFVSKETLYKISNWKLPPIIGPSFIAIPTIIYKILYKLRRFI